MPYESRGFSSLSDSQFELIRSHAAHQRRQIFCVFKVAAIAGANLRLVPASQSETSIPEPFLSVPLNVLPLAQPAAVAQRVAFDDAAHRQLIARGLIVYEGPR